MTQEKTLEQTIREYETNMPPEIMDMISKFDWKKELRLIINQNQIRMDVGTDLEQSVYLMILGVIKTADVYERLTETHEFSDDLARRILQELEIKIFNPLYKRPVELDGEEEKKTEDKVPSAMRSAPGAESRDAILAEIEDDGPDIDTQVRVIPHPAISTDTRDPIMSVPEDAGKVAVSTPPVSSGKIIQPFSLNRSPEVATAPVASIQTPVHAPVISPVTVATGIQKDPVQSGLNKPTAMAPEPAKSAPVTAPAPKAYASDPYREPIE